MQSEGHLNHRTFLWKIEIEAIAKFLAGLPLAVVLSKCRFCSASQLFHKISAGSVSQTWTLLFIKALNFVGNLLSIEVQHQSFAERLRSLQAL